jgi:hypothetical protein
MNLSDYESLFFRQKNPYWVIMDARAERKATTPKDVLEIADEKEQLKESWSVLLDAESDLEDGKYKIHLMSSPTGGKGKIVRDFQVGTVSTASVGATNARISSGGVGGLGGLGGLEFVTGLMTTNQNLINTYRDQISDLKMDNLRKDTQIERLKTKKTEKKTDDGIGSFLKGIVKEHFPDILRTWKPQYVHTPTTIASVEVPGGEVNPEEAAAKRMSIERLQAVMGGVMKLFPDEDPIAVLEIILEMAGEHEFVVDLIRKKLKKRHD